MRVLFGYLLETYRYFLGSATGSAKSDLAYPLIEDNKFIGSEI